MKRYAIIAVAVGDTPEQIKRYLPGNYRLAINVPVKWAPAGFDNPQPWWVIEGEDNAGWTLDDYVIPRLASGLHLAKEIDLSHSIMKLIPQS